MSRNSGNRRRRRPRPFPLIALQDLLHFSPLETKGELYTGIVRQIGAGISTEDSRRTLFIKYQPNTPGLYRAACRD
jgi:hypothetical protein